MARQVEPTPVPRNVRITGLVVAGVGVLAMTSAMGFATTSARLARLPHPGEPLPFLMTHYVPLAVTEAAFGALFVIAGLALARGRGWGRCAVIAFACLLAAFAICTAFAIAREETMWGIRIFLGALAAVYVVLAYLAVRGLNSPGIRAGCR